jgi:release factor glutamine methyltransferase
VNGLEAVRGVAQRLGDSGVPSPRVDAELLLAHVTGLSRSELYSVDRELSEDDLSRLQRLVERRQAREPLAYVLGEWGFRGLTLKVDHRVLVPRPETEVLVERCLEHLSSLPEPRVLDVGVGSGAIALAIADEHPGARLLAVDRSPEALAAARENLARAAVDGRVEFQQGDLISGVSGPFDLVVSNPPYVSPEEYETLEPEIRLFEPRVALVGVGVGSEIARVARAVLAPGGWLLLECGDGQAEDLAADLEGLGYRDVIRTRDLAGRERIVEGRLHQMVGTK